MAVNFMVPGRTVVYAQPNTMACWATVYAMMKAWKQGTAFPNIRAAIVPLGQPWLGYFDRNTGLPTTAGTQFESAVHLVREPRFNPSPQGWQSMLTRFGLIWVTGTVPGGIHDRILEGISGDETGPGTSMHIMDPDGGRRYKQTLADFLTGFEGQAAVEPFYQDYQILHF
ncbi:MAG TPA: papain-like cysteine protease family protein [Terriglobia bacterium]|nr:papain-like cysteine protease family protein [Terriglobia bacterium]